MHGRLKQLDILRAVAVLLVLGRHMPSPPADSLPASVMAVMGVWQQCGWIGVDMFFVLSGFLIAGLLFREYQRHGRVSLKRFYVRRGFKIYPPFYALLLATLVFRPLTGGEVWPRAAVVESLFIQNYSYGLWGHTWSLAVEEHFYFLLPLLLVGLLWWAKRNRWGAPFGPLVEVCVALGAGLLAFRVIHALVVPYSHRTHLFPTHLRIDSLMFGVLLSYFYHAQPDRLRAFVRGSAKVMGPLCLLFIAPSLFLDVKNFFMHTVGLTLLYLGFGGLLLLAMYAPPARWRWQSRAGSALAYMGCYSYSIYLWHIPFRPWVVHGLEQGLGVSVPYWAQLLIYAVGGVGAGILLAKLVEMPFLMVRDRFFPSRSQPMAGASTQPRRPQAAADAFQGGLAALPTAPTPAPSVRSAA